MPHARAHKARGAAARTTAAHARTAARTIGVHATVRRGCPDGHFPGMGHTGASTEARAIGVHAPGRRGCPDGHFLGVGHTGANTEAHPV